MLTFADYETAAVSTAIYPGQGDALGLMYVALKGAGEAGEFAGHLVTLRITDEHNSEELEIAMTKEIGDELWYLAAKARELGTSLQALLAKDIATFQDRAVENVDLSVINLALYGSSLAGNFAEYVGKAIRDDGFGQTSGLATALGHGRLTDDRRQWLVNNVVEHAQVLAQKAASLNSDLATIAQRNIDKLAARKATGKLGGSGDNR